MQRLTEKGDLMSAWLELENGVGRARANIKIRRWEGGSGLGTHVHLWRIRVNVWQNQYSTVKQNKVKIKI